MEAKGAPGRATPSPQALDKDDARKLWTIAEELTGASWKLLLMC